MTSSDRRVPSKKLSSSKAVRKTKFLKGIKSFIKISQGDLLGTTALKRSTKEAMNSYFRNAPYTKPSTRKTTTEM